MTPDGRYGTSARSYLLRARQRLDEGSQEALIYAALELRCGVEARLHEYLHFQEQIPRKRRKDWQVGRLGKTTDATFGPDLYAKLVVYDRNGRHVSTHYYTPVTADLRTRAQKLGNYLHAPPERHYRDDAWWTEFREELESILGEVRKATAGDLLGAPVRSPSGEILATIGPIKANAPITGVGRSARISVEYSDEFPRELVDHGP